MPPDQWRLIYVSDPSGNANYESPPIRDADNALGIRLLFSGLPEGAVVIDELEVTVLPR